MLIFLKQAVFTALFVQCCLCPGKSPVSHPTLGINTRERSLSVGEVTDLGPGSGSTQTPAVLIWGQNEGTDRAQSLPPAHLPLVHPVWMLTSGRSPLLCAKQESFFQPQQAASSLLSQLGVGLTFFKDRQKLSTIIIHLNSLIVERNKEENMFLQSRSTRGYESCPRDPKHKVNRC